MAAPGPRIRWDAPCWGSDHSVLRVRKPLNSQSRAVDLSQWREAWEATFFWAVVLEEGVFGSILWIYLIMFREAVGLLERCRDASGCSLSADTTRRERRGEVRLVYSPLLEHTTSKEGEEIGGG